LRASFTTDAGSGDLPTAFGAAPRSAIPEALGCVAGGDDARSKWRFDASDDVTEVGSPLRRLSEKPLVF